MLLYEVVVLLALACGGILLARAARVPPLVGYLVAGVVAGRGGLGLVHASAELESLAELGVALLLFGVGIEFSLGTMRRNLARTVVIGVVQVLASFVCGAGLLLAIGADTAAAVVGGFLVALSSTAIVFKLLDDAGEINAAHGRAAAGLLLIQDLALVPMMLLLPVLAGGGDGALSRAAVALLGAALALAAVVASARSLLPRGLEFTSRLRSPELMAPLALVVALGTALAADRLGLSLPLGAFLAGLALSGTPHAHRVFAELLPLRDAFVALFFTSVGLLFDPAVLWSSPLALVALLGGVAAKGVVVALVVGYGYRSARLGAAVGLSLAQIGEFSFVIVHQAHALGVIGDAMEQAYLAATLVTMAATPFWLSRGRALLGSGVDKEGALSALKDHVVLFGYGASGQAVARVLAATSIRFVVIEIDPVEVEQAHRDGIDAHLGDGSRRAALQGAGVPACRAAVVTVDDAPTARRIVGSVRHLNPTAAILVRAKRVDEIRDLERLGADEVVPEEFEASIELFARLLTRLGVPRHVARVQEAILRLDHYHAMRGVAPSQDMLPEIERLIGGGLIESAEVMEGSEAAGKTLRELNLREELGAAVLTVVHDSVPESNPGGDTRLELGDRVVLFGPHAAIAATLALLEPRLED